MGRRARPQRARGRHRRRRARAGVGRRRPTPREVADFLIGGITTADVRAGRRPGLGVQRPDRDAPPAAAELPVPARPVVLDLRRRHASTRWRSRPAQARDDDHGGDLPLPPDVHRPRSSRSGSAAPTRTGAAPRRGRRRAAHRQRRRDDRHGRAHHAPGRAAHRPRAVPGRRGDAGARRPPAEVAQLHAPRHGHDHVRPGPGHAVPRAWSTVPAPGASAPATAADDLVDRGAGRARSSRPWPTGARRSTRCGSSTTGGDEFEAEREQWDDGNNVVALEPGVVVAYERNTGTNTALRKAGIEVITIEASSSAAAAAARTA